MYGEHIEQTNYGIISGEISVLQHQIKDIDDSASIKSSLKDIDKKLSKMEKILLFLSVMFHTIKPLMLMVKLF